MSWGALATALLAFAGKLLDIFREKQLRQDGVAAQVSQDRKDTLDVVQTAQSARDSVERDITLNPEGLRDDDGFRRPVPPV